MEAQLVDVNVENTDNGVVISLSIGGHGTVHPPIIVNASPTVAANLRNRLDRKLRLQGQNFND